MSISSIPHTPSYAPFEPICEEHICPVTKGLLVDPYQTSCCGHYLSKEAVDGLLAQDARCPMCRAQFSCKLDKAFRRRVHQQLKVRCLAHGGCNWCGIYSDFLQHCGICINEKHDAKGTTPIVNKNVIEFSIAKFSSYLKERKYYESPSFYTHHKGYKMCFRVYPYGYDECEGTHLCAVTFLMNGDNDDRLQFPFHSSITLQILNQVSNGEDGNYERTFEYNDKTDDIMCRRVPESESMNSGIAMYNFIPLDELQNNNKYVENDSLKFRVAKIVVRSCSEQLQSDDIKSLTASDLNCEQKRISTNSMENDINDNRTRSNEHTPKNEADDNESSRARSITNSLLSNGSNLLMGSSHCHATDSVRENVPEHFKAPQYTKSDDKDGWETLPTKRKRDVYKGSKLVQHSADEALNSDARTFSSRTNSGELVEADGDSSIFGSNDSDRNDTESSEPFQNVTEMQESQECLNNYATPAGGDERQGTAQQNRQNIRRTYSDGAVRCNRPILETKKHHSYDGAMPSGQTERTCTGNYADISNGRREKQSEEGSRFIAYTLLGSTVTIVLAILITALLQKWQLPFQNLAPSIIANSAVSPSFYSTFTLTSSSSDTDNDTNQDIEFKMKNLANMVAFKVSAKWRLIGVQLELPTYVLNDIQSQVAREPDSNMHAFQLMMEKWKTLQTSPYTWRTMMEALESPAVGEMEVAADLRRKGIT